MGRWRAPRFRSTDAASLAALVWIATAGVAHAATQPGTVAHPPPERRAPQPRPAPFPPPPLVVPEVVATWRDSLELQLLDVRIDRWLLGVTLEAYAMGDRTFVPLGALAGVLGLPITVDRMAGQANGAAIGPRPAFHLDLETGRARVGDREERLEPGQVRRGDRDLLVDARALSAWLPAEFSIDPHAGTLDVRPTAPLPIEERRAREQRGRLAARAAPPSEVVPIENPYRWLGVPTLDERARWFHQPRGEEDSWRAETHVAGDLLRAEAHLYLTAGAFADEEPVRGSLGRKDGQGRLLGPLRATEITAGEVIDPGLPAVLTPHGGAGIVMSSYPLDQRSPSGLETFVGRLEPGWDVELYRNGALLGYLPAATGGEYRFDEAGLEPGLNEFEIVMHGPSGERRAERRVVNAEPSMPEGGALRYRVVALDPRVAGGRGHLDADFGWSRSVALVARAAQTDLVDGRHRFGELGVHVVAGRLETQLSGLVASGQGRAARASASARWGLLALTLEHFESRHWASEVFGPTATARRQRTWLRVSSAFTLPVAGGLPVTLETRPERERGDPMSDRSFGRATIGGGPWSLAYEHRGASVRDAGGTQVLEQGEERLALSGRSRQVTLRARATTDTHHPESRAFAVGLERDALAGLRATLELEHRPETREDALHLALSRPAGALSIGGHVDYSSLAGTSFEATLSFSAGFDPRSRHWRMRAQPSADLGRVSARVFLDSNGNGAFDPGETPVSGAQLLVNGSRRGEPTRFDGASLVADVAAAEPSDFSVLSESLQDPTWLAPRVARRLVPRAGNVAMIDLPLTIAGEITGTVVAKDGAQTPVSGIHLELVDTRSSRVVRQVVSSFDGFYDVVGIPPGDYVLRLAAAPGSVLAASPRVVHIAPTGTIDDGVTLVWATAPAAGVEE
jgi:hypothetical protein